jgi:hypothetical protein
MPYSGGRDTVAVLQGYDRAAGAAPKRPLAQTSIPLLIFIPHMNSGIDKLQHSKSLFCMHIFRMLLPEVC